MHGLRNVSVSICVCVCPCVRACVPSVPVSKCDELAVPLVALMGTGTVTTGHATTPRLLWALARMLVARGRSTRLPSSRLGWALSLRRTKARSPHCGTAFAKKKVATQRSTRRARGRARVSQAGKASGATLTSTTVFRFLVKTISSVSTWVPMRSSVDVSVVGEACAPSPYRWATARPCCTLSTLQ